MSRFIVIMGILAVCACQSKPKETPVARVIDEYLYVSDLADVVPPGTLQADSIEAIQVYIHNWIQQKLLLQKAKKNLPGYQKAFDQEIENYRNSLIIFAYQNALIEQAVDTIVRETEIENFYNENMQQFLLRNNIVRVRFAKLENYPESSRDRVIKEKIKTKESIVKLIFSKDLSGEEMHKLSKLCQEISINFYLNSDQWIYLNDLLKEIPIEIYNPPAGIITQEDFLRKNSTFQVQDGDHTYYVNVLEYRRKEDFSPIEFEREKIRNIILNNQKVKLIENLRNEVMTEGNEKKWFEIY
jgi:hypothetical protein